MGIIGKRRVSGFSFEVIMNILFPRLYSRGC